jgi:PAS domain-containing protein
MTPITDFHFIIFEAIPSPVFILDQDLCILDFNEAAVRMADPVVFETLRAGVGEFPGCANVERCGTFGACRGCEIRSAAAEALRGGNVRRRAMRMRAQRDGQLAEAEYLITAVPFQDGLQPLVLMMLEDLDAMIAARDSLRPMKHASAGA